MKLTLSNGRLSEGSWFFRGWGAEGVADVMAFPIFFPAFVKRFKALHCSFAVAAKSCVDAERPSAYIGGGPHLPNEVLSFWKE
jgi:hypothetical protein